MDNLLDHFGNVSIVHLFPLFFLVFVLNMARRFKRTVVLDLSGFSSDLPRYDVAKLVYKRFEGSSSVQSIQFVPGKKLMYKLPLKTLRLKKVLRSTRI